MTTLRFLIFVTAISPLSSGCEAFIGGDQDTHLGADSMLTVCKAGDIVSRPDATNVLQDCKEGCEPTPEGAYCVEDKTWLKCTGEDTARPTGPGNPSVPDVECKGCSGPTHFAQCEPAGDVDSPLTCSMPADYSPYSQARCGRAIASTNLRNGPAWFDGASAEAAEACYNQILATIPPGTQVSMTGEVARATWGTWARLTAGTSTGWSRVDLFAGCTDTPPPDDDPPPPDDDPPPPDDDPPPPPDDDPPPPATTCQHYHAASGTYTTEQVTEYNECCAADTSRHVKRLRDAQGKCYYEVGACNQSDGAC